MNNIHDVKMPVYKDTADDYSEEQVKDIEKLLDYVNAVDTNLVLRLGEEYYGKFKWFGETSSSKKSYFSYQEEAVYNFIFDLNKSGILSDQVGMGKTIEAGMIISELASRKELKSLLIIVPNEIMSSKWKQELEDKFGIKPVKGFDEYPSVTVIRNYDDFCLCAFECLKQDKFATLENIDLGHEYKKKADDTLAGVLQTYIKSDIKKVVDMINDSFEIDDMKERVTFDGKKFALKGTNIQRDYVYDANGVIDDFVNKYHNMRLEVLLNLPQFSDDYRKLLEVELSGAYTLIGDYFLTNGKSGDVSSMTAVMTKRHPILVVPISYAGKDGKSVDFLNRTLMKAADNYKHRYIVRNGRTDELDFVCEQYRVIDFFIDVGYRTMIVDEVHDYIDVESKVNRDKFHADAAALKAGQQVDGKLYSSDEYDRFELFDDYYFIKKSSLYKKLKSLADKANRKIFLTATPIKSDMVDFYLLTLLASNKDADIYKKLQTGFAAIDFAKNGEQSNDRQVQDLFDRFDYNLERVAEHFTTYSDVFLEVEEYEDGKKGEYKYPYFNNSYVIAHQRKKEDILEYLKSYATFMTVEEIFMELLIAFNAETRDENEDSNAGFADMETLFGKLNELMSGHLTDRKYIKDGSPDDLLTRVVFRALLGNTLKTRFEEDFSIKDENGTPIKPIKRIRELLEQPDGTRIWDSTYKKYGIRHTRHQTYNLSECEYLDKFSDKYRARYSNLPLWPRRNGNVIFLVRDDVFFDRFIDVRDENSERGKRLHEKAPEIKIENLPNYGQLVKDIDKSKEQFEYAKGIFDYINESMSGGDENHLPSSSKYESYNLDDDGMAEYKLALVTKLMMGSDPNLGSVKKKVLLFAENGRDEILNWFGSLKCRPLADKFVTDAKSEKTFADKLISYGIAAATDLFKTWNVSQDASLLTSADKENVLIIIDPKRYEKGVDMQKADTIINFDINYDPLKMEQRIGRIDRIRPKGAEQSINIISFVPLNDMSGFVINFFANEMKMFTQWMGETTGIVSVPEDADSDKSGGDISFEGRVKTLERFYKYVYRLCTTDVSAKDREKMAEEFGEFFKLDKEKMRYDFDFLQELRPVFDGVCKNSFAPLEGLSVDGSSKKVVRFNSTRGQFAPCGKEKCDICPQRSMCQEKGKEQNNVYSLFARGVNEFFDKGVAYYDGAHKDCLQKLDRGIIKPTEGGGQRLDQWLFARKTAFEEAGKKVRGMLGAHSEPYPMPLDTYRAIFDPLKNLYWDECVAEYLDLILEKFHAQCDSVLDGAKLFENFIKTFSIAGFMNNMRDEAAK